MQLKRRHSVDGIGNRTGRAIVAENWRRRNAAYIGRQVPRA
jgi:hypothetical protein